MNKKKSYSLIALFCIVIALVIYLTTKKENGLHDFFWMPLLLSAVFLFVSSRVK